MFDDLRDTPEEEMLSQSGIPYEFQPAPPERRIAGMTAVQRLILSVLLFATVAVLGMTCLLGTGKLWC